MDDESGETMELMEEVPFKSELGRLERLSVNFDFMTVVNDSFWNCYHLVQQQWTVAVSDRRNLIWKGLQ